MESSVAHLRVLSLLAMAVLLFSHQGGAANSDAEMEVTETNQVLGTVGAILDYSSRIGKEQKVAVEIAVEDVFFHTNQSLILQLEDSHGDPIQAARAATQLINAKDVEAILGPRTWEEASTVAEIGSHSRTPVLSFADLAPWTTMKWPFLIQASPSQYAQTKAVASIVQSWGWRRVVVIYEDNDSSANGVIPHLHQSLLEVDAQISQFVAVSPFASSSLYEELGKLKRGQCRVFVVHTSLPLAIQLFENAKKMEMMEKGYVWITTGAITSLVHAINSTVISSMRGVLGVTSFSQETGASFHDFYARFVRKFRLENPEENNYEPGILALQAYDATMAVAKAMAEGNIEGQALLEKILLSDFDGLSGRILFTGHKLPPASSFQIINVIGKGYREHGFWSDGLGFSETIDKGAKYNNSMENLGHVYWPGGLPSTPKGWTRPTNSNKLRIAVGNGTMFNLFVTITHDPVTDNYTFSGFSVEAFRATVEKLPYDLSYELIPFMGTFDDLVEQVHLKFDAAAGSTAITAKRYKKVDFSLPHTDASLVMIVPAQSHTNNKAMLFLKPFTTSMWVLTVVTSLYNGLVIWILEREGDPELRGSVIRQVGTLIWMAFAMLFSRSQPGEKLRSKLSKMATLVWLFVAMVVLQSYTANLSSMLTVTRMEPTVADIETLKYNGAMIGFGNKSFAKSYLTEVLKFNPNCMKNYSSPEGFALALRSKEIAAAFIEAPWAKLFLDRYCNSFIAAGPKYRVGGYAFVFPKGSPILSDMNVALMQVIDSGRLRELENNAAESESCIDVDSNDQDVSLSPSSFWVLFMLTGGTSTIALVMYISMNV
ncbi:glutamate receptor 2.1-like isoform X2 [Diospyros lotus]|uniref:glutamate receptor 2.1-like isoform X2 n=1 Tax=Diospyros lotus TaxID=55363 RepID=UPI00225765D5|nr:glutamate receptor 2.1-like isoform X2 [Diospyros lotus]